MEFNLLVYDQIILRLMAALLILVSREIFRNWLLSVSQFREGLPSLASIDPISIGCLSLFGISWGGLIQPQQKDTFLTFILSQLWFIVLMTIAIFYFKFNSPSEGSNFYIFLKILISMCFGMFVINWIPILPMDGSWFYAQTFVRKRPILQYAIGGIILVILFFTGVPENLVYQDDFIKFIGF